jgi:polar amino acid transport system substrate-binding protein
MRKGGRFGLATVVVLVLAFALAAGGCGAKKTAAQSAAENWTKILGHAPTGLAKQVLDRGTLIVADDAHFAPQSYVDFETKQLVGFDVDVAKATGAILGIPVKFVNPVWETVPAGLSSGRWDVSIGSMPVTADRKTEVSFTEPYYYAFAQTVMKTGGTPISDVTGLFDHKVGVVADTTYFTFLRQYPRIHVLTYATDLDALSDLQDGKIDYVVSAGPVAQRQIQEAKPFAFTGKPLFFEDLAFATRIAGSKDMIALFNHAIERMHADGQLTSMSKRWYNSLDLTVK